MAYEWKPGDFVRHFAGCPWQDTGTERKLWFVPRSWSMINYDHRWRIHFVFSLTGSDRGLGVSPVFQGREKCGKSNMHKNATETNSTTKLSCERSQLWQSVQVPALQQEQPCLDMMLEAWQSQRSPQKSMIITIGSTAAKSKNQLGCTISTCPLLPDVLLPPSARWGTSTLVCMLQCSAMYV